MKATFFILFFLASINAKENQASRSPGAITSGASDKPIEVKGQTRNLNMLLKLKSEKEEIDFIKLREEYEQEIKDLNY
jgi:hypothetical protein